MRTGTRLLDSNVVKCENFQAKITSNSLTHSCSLFTETIYLFFSLSGFIKLICVSFDRKEVIIYDNE